MTFTLPAMGTSHFSNRRASRGTFPLDGMTGQSLMVHKALKGCVYLINERLLTNYLNNLDSTY